MENTVPTDSVLRRHYEASHSKTSENKPSQNNSNNSGIMSWLKRLFGG